MSPLRRADLESILGFVADAGTVEFDRPYPPELLARLAGLVPCAAITYQEIDVPAQRMTLLMGPDGELDPDDEGDALYWAIGPCPIVTHRTRTADLGATRLSDLVAWRAYRETPIYRDYFAPFGVEHMLDLGLEAEPGCLRSFILFRDRGDGDFSVRDREVLETLRPHLARLEAEASLRRRLMDPDPGRAKGTGHPVVPSPRLTAREREIVELVAEGRTNAEIAAHLWVAPSTVKKHLENVYEKLGVGRRTAAATLVRYGD